MLNSVQAVGHQIRLAVSDARHFGSSDVVPPARSADGAHDFGGELLHALERVNDAQQRAIGVEQSLVTDPSGVDIHDVTIAIAEANLAIQTTKAIVDGAIRAYREIISLR